jgi:propanol-preferring alcohol dehydrogenase
MVLTTPHAALQPTELRRPKPTPHQLLIEVLACGVCRTDLHVVDGELADAKLPLIPGHEIVGRVVGKGSSVEQFALGDRVGVPWLGQVCGVCAHCRSGRENLCDHARFTGYHIDGGYAEYTVADQRFCFAIPDTYDDINAAPLLCAGLIGYRAMSMAGDARRLGIYGFGAAAHIVAQIARHHGRAIYAYTRPGDKATQQFARDLGAVWAGDSGAAAPDLLDAAIIFAPVGALVPLALRAVRKGGTVVCAGIHMSEIPAFPYGILWGERSIKSVANLTRGDGEAFLDLAAQVPLQISTITYALDQANVALDDLRNGRFNGAAVLVPHSASASPGST